jgi:hypothetical protein
MKTAVVLFLRGEDRGLSARSHTNFLDLSDLKDPGNDWNGNMIGERSEVRVDRIMGNRDRLLEQPQSNI